MSETKLFDAMAAAYDRSFSETPIGALQRKIVHEFLHPLIASHEKFRILELNCGTGTDAVFIAAFGHQVLATDASTKMLEQAENKIMAQGFGEYVKTQCCSFQQIPEVLAGQTFDMIFSNFGGLNCIDTTELKKLADCLSDLLSPGGQCIFVVMGTDCRWEQHYFLLKGKLRLMFRRFRKQGVLAHYEGYSSLIFYHSPKALAGCFSSSFETITTRPVGLFIPPSYLNPRFENKSGLLKLLCLLEKGCKRISFLSNLADHYLIHLEKR
jgi:ubiquinone/menaquinone biosynthesis C-methylase UbiE